MKVIFCHGLESGPVGRKSQALRQAGHDVVAPDCRGEDLPARVARIVAAIAAEPEPPLLVGSSFGGIAGLCAAIVAAQRGCPVAGIVLCAPALQVAPPPGIESLRPPVDTVIVHGVDDEVIPIDVSRTFSRRWDNVRLIEVEDGHALGGTGLEVILEQVRARARAL